MGSIPLYSVEDVLSSPLRGVSSIFLYRGVRQSVFWSFASLSSDIRASPSSPQNGGPIYRLRLILLSRCWPTLRALFLLVPTSQRFGIVLFCFLSSSVLATRAVLSTLISERCVDRSVNYLGRSLLSSLRNFIFHWRLAERFRVLSSTLFGLKS